MSVEQFKKSILAACELYQQEVKAKSKAIHPIRLKDLNLFQTLLKQIDDKPLLELKIKEHLSLMSTKGRVWSLYLLSTGHSRLKELVEKILIYYNADTEFEYLKQSIAFYESELAKRDIEHKEHIATIQNDYERLLNLKNTQCQQEIEHLKQQIDFLLEENLTLKDMLAKQSNIIKTQLEQIMTLSLTEAEIKVSDQDKISLTKEVGALEQASVFNLS